MPHPLVAVVVPAYNAERYLADTLRSVQLQTMADFELIVVDDGSTDGTRLIAEQFARSDRRVRVLTQKNRGVAAARNLGWRTSTAPFVAPLDSDDLWHPRKLELQMERFQVADERVGLVYAWTQRIDEEGRVLPRDTIVQVAEGDVIEELVESNLVGHASGALIRRACLEQAGGFDESLWLPMDCVGCDNRRCVTGNDDDSECTTDTCGIDSGICNNTPLPDGDDPGCNVGQWFSPDH